MRLQITSGRTRGLAIVTLVGAGPGDPDLLTVGGLKALQQAEVVVHDRLVSGAVLAFCSPEAELINVGKKPREPNQPSQEWINSVLVENGHRQTVRLKGGDPFVFGRGFEEILALESAGVEWKVIPGVTSAIAAPASAGIPVTHRGLANSFAVFSGHEADSQHEDTIPWSAAAQMPTAIFLMGVERLTVIVAKLIEHGRVAQTPVAIIQSGTLAGQRVVRGTLETILELAKDVASPAVIVVGAVAGLKVNR